MKPRFPFVLLLSSLAVNSSTLHIPLQHQCPLFADAMLNCASTDAVTMKSALILHRTERYIHTIMEKWNASGLSAAVVRKDTEAPNGWRFEFGGYGVADGRGSPVTADTVFAIASNSKLFLAISTGLLIYNKTLAEERGQEIKWSTKIADLIPEWQLLDNDMSRGVTIQDMLSHRTGMPRHEQSGFHRPGGIPEMISTLRYLRPSAELRETFQYNNLMYETLSYLPKVLLNQSYESYVAQHLFDPLNMTASTFSVAVAEARGTLANGFLWDMSDTIQGKKDTHKIMDPYFLRPGEEGTWAGAAGILTSARDLATWVAMLMNNGRHPYADSVIIVPSEIIEHVAHGRSVSHGKPQFPEMSVKTYGAGQWRYSYQGVDIIEHGGENPGFKSQVARFPNDNLGIVTLCNDETGGMYIADTVKFRIADELLGLKELDWNDRYENNWRESVQKAQLSSLPRPPSPIPPTLPYPSLAEKSFSHPTYGVIQPCLVPGYELSDSGLPHTHTHKYCSSLLQSHSGQRILSMSNTSIPTYIIPFKRMFATHIRLTHYSGNNFNGSVLWTNNDAREREGYEKDGDVVAELFDRFDVEWVTNAAEEGLAFKGNFWGMEGLDVKSPEGTGRDSAEVWFSSESYA